MSLVGNWFAITHHYLIKVTLISFTMCTTIFCGTVLDLKYSVPYFLKCVPFVLFQCNLICIVKRIWNKWQNHLFNHLWQIKWFWQCKLKVPYFIIHITFNHFIRELQKNLFIILTSSYSVTLDVEQLWK